jgi:protein-tyrosine-phosphatase
LTEPNNRSESVPDAQKSGPDRGRNRFLKDFVKRCLPEFVLQPVQRYRRYRKTGHPLHLKPRLLDSIGLGDGKMKAPAGARSFLFVCFGNIMRSPMCEALMKRQLAGQSDQITINSAGLHAKPGNAAHDWAIAAAREFGVSLETHGARLLSPTMVEQADVIFAMDYQNRAELRALYPEASRKIVMLGAYADRSLRGVEIPDPFYGNAEGTRACYQVLQKCVRQLVSEVLQDLQAHAYQSQC